MALSIEEFLRHIADSELLPVDDVLLWLEKLTTDSRPQNGETLARWLVAQKKLTKFQAEQIYAGKGKSLTLGNYVILEKLGQGGMGMVYKAQHKRMGRVVALKVMSAKAMQSPISVQRFHREVQMAAKLTHPNIVTAHDADEAKGTHFLVMELVDGEDLAVYVNRHGPMTLELTIECIIQAARGLGYAHAQGVVHRDIKPHNLLMQVVGSPLLAAGDSSSGLRTTDNRPTIKILDMGLARLDGSVGASADHADLTNSGAMMGTVDYMAPEQAMDSKRADARSDIYSLGCTMFYLLTGRATFNEDTVMKRLTAHQSAQPPSLEVEAPQAFLNWHGGNSVTGSGSWERLATLDVIFQRMVAKRPADRFQSMNEVIGALENCRKSKVSWNDGATTTDSAMRNFLQDITGEGSTTTRATAADLLRTKVLPGANEVTIIESQFEQDADATCNETLAQQPQVRVDALTKSPYRALIAGVLAAVLLLVVGFFAMRGPSGTLHLEVGDELTQVTVGETGRVVKGRSEQDLHLPPGEYVLHLEREKLAFDTDAFELTKNETVSIKVERVGRRVHVMQGNRFLGHIEMSAEDLAVTGDKPTSTTKPPSSANTDPRPSSVTNLLTARVYDFYATKLPLVISRDPDGLIMDHTVPGTTYPVIDPVDPKGWDPAESTIRARVRELAPSPEDSHLWIGFSAVGGKGRLYVSLRGKPGARRWVLASQADWSDYSTFKPIIDAPASESPDGVRDLEFRFENSTAEMFESGKFIVKASDIEFQPYRPIIGVSKSKWLIEQWTSQRPAPSGAARSIDDPPLAKVPFDAKQDRAPQAAWALEFDGRDDYVDLQSDWQYDGSDLTLEAWVVAAPLEEPCACHLLAIESQIGMDRHAVRLRRGRGTTPSGQVSQDLHVSAPPSNIVRLVNDPLPVNRLAHLAAVWTSSERRLFVDGKPIRLYDYEYPFGDRSGPSFAWLGAFSEVHKESKKLIPKDCWSGQIRQVRLTAKGLYDREFVPPQMMTPDTSTIALYLFNEGSGDVLRDSSGHNRHGKIVGAKWVAVPAISSASSDSSRPTPKSTTAAMSHPDRIAAEWVLSLQGSVSIREPGRPPRLISQAGQLPSGEFEVAYIDFQSPVSKDRVTDDGLRNLRRLKALKVLNLNYCRNVSAAGLLNLSDSELLESVDLNSSKINDQAVEELIKLRSLKTVGVGETQISDAGIERLFRELPVLEALSLSANSTDKCLKAVAEARNLKSLHGLKSKHLTDDGIGSLLNAPQITTLNVVVATDAVLRKIEVLTQTTQIYLNLCLATPTGIHSLVKLPRLEVLGLSDSPKIGDEHLEKLSEMRSVTELHLQKSGVTDHGIKSLVGLMNLRVLSLKETAITDQAVTDLSQVTNLRRLNITETKLTAKGVDTLRKALSNCRITSDHGTFGPLMPLNDAPPAAKAPFDAAQAKKHQEAWAKHLGTTVETTNSAGTKMVLIPPGEFLMGSTDEQVAAALNMAEQANIPLITKDDIQKAERPQHRVILTKPYRLAATEITVAQFKKFAAATGHRTEAEQASEARNYLNPSYPKTDDGPATWISWNDAVAYCEWLGQVENASYRLPTEAEWEFACRAGTVSQFWFGDDNSRLDETDWFSTNSSGHPHPVGTRLANPFGLHDLYGNAREWCFNNWHPRWYENSPLSDPSGPEEASLGRSVRGGSWYTSASVCRSAFRNGSETSRRNDASGFRVLQVLASLTATAAPPRATVPFDSKQAQTNKSELAPDRPTRPDNAAAKDRDRIAAEWVIALGGSVTVLDHDGYVNNVNDLPTGKLVLSKVTLAKARLNGSDADLGPLRGLTNVYFVLIDSSNVSATGIENLASLPKLTNLSASEIARSDDHFTAITRHTKVTALYLVNASMTAERCAKLSETMPQLKSLNLMDNKKLDDSALAPLSKLQKLERVQLQRTNVTAVGVGALKKALPNCKIEWDDPDQSKSP